MHSPDCTSVGNERESRAAPFAADRSTHRAHIPTSPTIRLVAFDLDGTLLRGDTVCQAIARRMGHLTRMNEIERLQDFAAIAAARSELAGYYQSHSRKELESHVAICQLAPGTEQGLQLLQAHGIAIAIVSITWDFGVKWFARQLGADYWVGTELSDTGAITHFWPQDKPVWLANLMSTLNLNPNQVAAVGDSSGDVAMLNAAGHRFYVGREMPTDLVARHRPNGNILAIAQEIVSLA